MVVRARCAGHGQYHCTSSRSLLVELGLHKIFEFSGWEVFLQKVESTPLAYKSLVIYNLKFRSRDKWHADLVARSQGATHLWAQQFLMSVGARLLEADR